MRQEILSPTCRRRHGLWVGAALAASALFAAGPPAFAAVSVDLHVNPAPAQPGEQVLVEIAVANDGSGPESGLQVQLPYPAGLGVLGEALVAGEFNASISCSAVGFASECSEGDTLFFDLSTIPPGDVRLLSFPVSVSASLQTGDSVEWNAEVVDTSGSRGSDSFSLAIDDNALAALRIDQDRYPVAAGDVLTYTVHYGNPSAGSFVDSELELSLPAGTTFLSATGGGTHEDGTVSWSFGDLPAGFVARQTVQVEVGNAIGAGTLLAARGTFGTTANFLPSTREARSNTLVGDEGPLALSLQVNPRPAVPGEQVLLSLNLANTSASPVFDAEVFVRFPQQVNTVAEALVLGGFDAAGSCAQVGFSSECSANDFLFWRFDVVNPGQSIELSLPATVASGAASGALIDWKAQLIEGNGSQAVRVNTLAVDANAVTSVAIDEDKDPVAAGDVLTYTVQYGNPAATSLIDSELLLRLPAGTTLLTATGGPTVNGNELSWSFGDLAAGFVGRQVVEVLVDGALVQGSLLEVDAALTGVSNFFPATALAQETAAVNDPGPLALDFNINPSPARPGEQVLVSLDLANTSASPVFDAQVLVRFPLASDTVPEGFITGGFDASGSCAQVGFASECSANDFMVWHFDVVNPGQSIELSLPVTVASGAASGRLIDWGARVTEANGSRLRESNTLAVDSNAVASLAIDEDRDPVAAGDVLTYTVHYANPSVAGLSDSLLTVTLPPNTTLLTASEGAMVNGDEVSWMFGDLPAGFADRQTVQVQVDAGLVPGSLLQVNGEFSGTSNFLPAVRRAQETTYVNDGGPLALTLNVNPRPAQAGEQVLVSLNVANPTASPVFDAEVLVRFPQNSVTVAESLFLGDFDAAGSCAQAGFASECSTNDLMVWRFDVLNPGQAVDVSFPVSVGSGTASGTLVDWSARLTEANGSRLRRTQTLTVDSNAIAALAIDEDKDPVAAGDVVTYTVSYGNPSVSGIDDSTLHFELPPDTIFLGASDAGTFDGTRVSWDLGDLPVGTIGRRVVQLRVRAVAPQGELLPVTAALEGISDFREANRRVSETAYVADDSPLDLRLTVNPLPGTPGGQESITLLLENTSGDTVLDAQVVLRFALGTNTLAESEVTGGLDTATSCNAIGFSSECSSNEFLFWNFPSLAPGEQRELTLPPFVSSGTALGSILDWRARVTEASGSETWESVPLPIGSAADTDGDGVADAYDNCTQVANADQRDSNGDGFGNLCDGDFNGDLITNVIDFRIFRQSILSTDSPDQDLNGDGIVNGADFVILRDLLGRPPGPSGLVP